MEQEFQALSQQEKNETNLLELICRLWLRRKMIYKVCCIAIMVGLVIVFSLPKEYTVTVTLSPESGKTGSNNLAGAAALLGLGNVGSTTEGDALNIILFPDILASDPFALELYNMPISLIDNKESIPLNEYIENRHKVWWIYILELPRKAMRWGATLFEDEQLEDGYLNPFRLTKSEWLKLELIKDAMSAQIDKNTGVTTISVTLQDAVVAATVADSVIMKLQNYITSYRTKKAAEDCAYLEKLYKERQQEYYQAQQEYAVYVDENKNLYTQKSRVEGERLQNEMNLAYQMYNQMATQLQLARAKIQEAKPVFAVVNPATVPVKPSSPRKALILLGIFFVTAVGVFAWILFGEDIWNELKLIIKIKN